MSNTDSTPADAQTPGTSTQEAGTGVQKAGTGSDRCGNGTQKAGTGSDRCGNGTQKASTGSDRCGEPPAKTQKSSETPVCQFNTMDVRQTTRRVLQMARTVLRMPVRVLQKPVLGALIIAWVAVAYDWSLHLTVHMFGTGWPAILFGITGITYPYNILWICYFTVVQAFLAVAAGQYVRQESDKPVAVSYSRRRGRATRKTSTSHTGAPVLHN